MSLVGFPLCWCCLDAAAGAAWVLLLMLLVGGGDEVCGGLEKVGYDPSKLGRIR